MLKRLLPAIGFSFILSALKLGLRTLFEKNHLYRSEATDYISAMSNQPISILVAEDNESTLKIIRSFLERLGYKADFANNGQEAVEMFSKKTYDLIFMDLNMPNMDGISALDCIKTDIASSDKTYPLQVALTENIDQDDKDRFTEVAFDRTVMKPVSPENLRDCIENALQRKIYIESLPSKLNRKFGNDYPLNVLVVDDEPINGRVTMKYLEAIGYHPTYVNNGLEAIELTKTNSYDIIFMDIRMPEMDGFETTDRIREQFYEEKAQGPFSPSIVALTSVEILETKQGYSAGMFDNHLTKPIQVEKLANILYVSYERKERICGQNVKAS